MARCRALSVIVHGGCINAATLQHWQYHQGTTQLYQHIGGVPEVGRNQAQNPEILYPAICPLHMDAVLCDLPGCSHLTL